MQKEIIKFISIFIIFSFHLFGEDSLYKNGEKIYFANGCLNCHGTKATGLHNYPTLANRSKWDLKRRLLKYRKGVESSQQSLIMIPFARNLSNKDIDSVSYFLENFVKDKNIQDYDIEYESWGDGGS